MEDEDVGESKSRSIRDEALLLIPVSVVVGGGPNAAVSEIQHDMLLCRYVHEIQYVQ